MNTSEQDGPPVAARLGLWDAVSIIVGIVVGASIFKAPPLVFSNVSTAWEGMALWIAGGVLSLCGALCYAELASTYPRSGGDYVYLTRAYGRAVGFLFGFSHLSGVLTGSIGVMAFVFADYALALFAAADGTGGLPNAVARGRTGSVAEPEFLLAAGAVVALTVLNAVGVVLGKVTQNLLTVAKVVGLSAIVVAGFVWGGTASREATAPMSGPGLGLAMIFVLYAYGGWSDAAFVAAEVRDSRRNIPRALILGTCGITVIYLLVNAAYVWGLGMDGLRGSSTPAADVLRLLPISGGALAMSAIVMVSALGALNGLIFTGSRVHASLGADHRVFAWLGRWNRRVGTPVWALVAQGVISVSLIFVAGTSQGRGLFDQALRSFGLLTPPWERFGGGFETLIAATAPVFWTFFLLTGLSVFVLRWKDRTVERPFRVPLFPVVPVLFCATCGYMLYSSLTYAREIALIGLVPLACGVPLYLISGRMEARTM